MLTNWHVVAIVRGDRTIATDDGLLHRRLGVPRWLGDTDLAIVEFLGAIEYKVAPISAEPAAVGEPLLAAGFPAGAQVWVVARGFVELLLPKSLPQGYAWAIQMRLKSVSVAARFLMPTEPTAKLLEKMIKSSWGIPISIYLQFVSSHLGS